ncbi:MAG TPA: ABC transporter permease [Streptosporangiaceae bacterium]|jgi:ABC-2 type transport system permease protein|nr:ABC transporter permease [Streptosporangiaceae bacterium]
MTAMTVAAAAPALRKRAGLAGTIRSEFTKIRSVRSTYWTLILLVLAGLAWSVIYCAATAHRWATMGALDKQGFDATQGSVIGLALLGQLVIVVLGALTITSEYSNQSIRTSLTVMPRRGVLFGAKAAVFTAVAAVTAIVASFASFFIGQRLLASTHAAATLSTPRALQAVVMTAMFVVLCGLFAYGLGAVLRNTAGTITAAYGFLFLLPQLAKALDPTWYYDLVRWLPGGDFVALITSSSAGQPVAHMFSAWTEMGIFAAYVAVLLALGASALRTKDA